MSRNTLFQFITYLKKNTQGDTYDKFVLKKSSNNSRYYCIELPVKEQIKLPLNKESLLLTEHHISVYENENKANPNLSQYHYTAYFQDGDGVNYGLHVYFDDNNQLTKSPTLENRSTNQVIAIDAIEKQLTTLAIRFTYPEITDLKKQQHDRIKKRRDEYDTLMVKLNDAWFDSNLTSKDMQALVTPALVLSTELSTLVNSKMLLKEHRLLEVMQKSLQQSAKQSFKVVESELPVVKQEKMETPSAEKQEEPIHKSNHNASRQDTKDKAFNLAKELEAIEDLYRQINEEKETARQVKKIEAFLSLTAEFILLHEEQVNWVDLKHLQELKSKVCSIGNSLFIRLLIGEQLDLAKEMPSFYYQITPSILALVLKLHNKSLLEFVLRHADFDISQAVTIDQQTYASAVHACIALSKNKDMCDCFSLLIQHNQSLLTFDEQGKPVILPVLIGSDHPLKKSLLATREKTIDSVPFLKSMVSMLQNYLEGGAAASQEEELLKELIVDFSRDIEFLQKMKGTPGLKVLREYSNSSFNNLNKSELLTAIEKEPEFIFLSIQLDSAARGLLQRANSSQLSIDLKKISEWGDGLKNYLNELDLSELTYEELKSEILSLFKNSLAIIDKKNEILTLSETCRVTYGSSKATKKAANRQRLLLQEIKELSKDNPFIQLLAKPMKESSSISFFNLEKELHNFQRQYEKHLENYFNDLQSQLTFWSKGEEPVETSKQEADAPDERSYVTKES